MLIVPFIRRRTDGTLTDGARLKVPSAPAPTPDQIRARDQERFIADPSFTAAASDEEMQQIRALQASRTADEIALALVRLNDARLPAPEDLMIDSGPPQRDGRMREKRTFDRPRAGFTPRGDRVQQREHGTRKPVRERAETANQPTRGEGLDLVWAISLASTGYEEESRLPAIFWMK